MVWSMATRSFLANTLPLPGRLFLAMGMVLMEGARDWAIREMAAIMRPVVAVRRI
jgi:hypothetical protein